MLYVTTRGKIEVYTVARTLQMDKGNDGGCFVPFRMPMFDKDDLKELAQYKPTQNIANMLNLFFDTKLTDWDVELALGRNGFFLTDVGHKLSVVELWHNRSGRFQSGIYELARMIHPDGDIIGKPMDWVQMAIRISLMLGVMTKLMADGQVGSNMPVNVALSGNDFNQVMAVWYLRQMGLPIGDIIIGCNENSCAWELINRGCVDTDAAVIHTDMPDADFAVPPAMERLICGACDQKEAMKFCWSMTEQDTYVPDEEAYEQIKKGLYAAVISKARIGIVIPSVYRSHQYVMDLYTALGYAALSDYRSKTGDGTLTLLISENSPLYHADAVSCYMHISEEELRSRVR